ncbi:MAG: sigma factor [Knoellia sp.]
MAGIHDDAFAEFATAATPGLLRTAWLICGNASQAEDLVQSAMGKVYLRWGKLRHGQPQAHARKCILNDHIDRHRRRRHEATAEILDYRYAVEVGPSGAGRSATVTVFSVDAGKRTRLDRWTANPGVITRAPKEIAPGILLLVAPARARTFTLVSASDIIPAFADAKPVVGTDYQAVTFRLPTDFRAGTPSDVIWTDDTGAFDQTGNPLPSVVNPTSEEMLVLDPERRLIMSQRANGSSGSVYPAGSTPWTGDGFDTRASKVQFLSATFVIPTQALSATDTTVRWNNGISTPATILGKPGSEWTFLRTEREVSPKV